MEKIINYKKRVVEDELMSTVNMNIYTFDSTLIESVNVKIKNLVEFGYISDGQTKVESDGKYKIVYVQIKFSDTIIFEYRYKFVFCKFVDVEVIDISIVNFGPIERTLSQLIMFTQGILLCPPKTKDSMDSILTDFNYFVEKVNQSAKFERKK